MQTKMELEACVAACVLMAGGKTGFHVDIPIDDFELPAAKAVIVTASELGAADTVLVKKHAKTKGIEITISELSELLMILPTSKNLMSYIAHLKHAIYQQKLDSLRKDFLHRAKAGDLIQIAKDLQAKESELCAAYIERQTNTDLVETSADLINRIEAGIDSPDLIPTGQRMFDEMLGGGMLPNELTVIAARPSIGKTAFGLEICLDSREKCLFFSLEMSKKQLAPRLLSAISLQNTKIANRQPSMIPDHIRKTLLAASAELITASERIVVVDDPDQSVESIRRIARKEVDSGARFVLIDYLQLIRCKGETREQAIAGATRELKNMTKELNVPVILLAQLNRGCESENRLPRLSDLRESGAIEQDANNVLFIHKVADIEDGKMQVALILAKGRDVGQGFRKAVMNPSHQRFYPLEGS